MENNIVVIEHLEDCHWTLKEIEKTVLWFKYMELKNCPACKQPIKGNKEDA